MKFTRRHFLGAVSAASLSSPSAARGQGLTVAALPGDSSAAVQDAMNRAARSGVELVLEAGRYQVSGLNLPSGLSMRAVPGATTLVSRGNAILSGRSAEDVTLSGLRFDGSEEGAAEGSLIDLQNCTNVSLNGCSLASARGNGITTFNCSGRISACNFSDFGETALHLQDSAGIFVSENLFQNCGNGGVRIWRYTRGFDGTIVRGNRIDGIGSTSGNGQNGNGINVFQADGVICADNVISDCDFSALRANTTNDTIFSGNQCFDCREVAIFSEFGFSGTIISNNLVDGAATGISITNLDSEGHLAVCSGNMVRNITRNSPTNPDTIPIGIFAEADTAVTGNVVENVPGTGIAAGWGPYLRNVLISDNLVGNTLIGIAVSVAEGAGAVRIDGNLIAAASAAAIAGTRWREVATADLIGDAALYPHVDVSSNSVS